MTTNTERRYTQQSPFKLFLEKTVKSNVYLYKFAFWFKERFLGSLFHEEDLDAIDLLKFDKNKDNCIDIGANVGQSISFFKPRFHKILAFEPNPGNFKLLKKKYGSGTIDIQNVALGSKEGNMKLYVPFWKSVSLHHTASLVKEECYETLGEFLNLKPESIRFETHDVEVSTLDNYTLDNVGLIKIDAEGYESEIMPGMEKYLAQDVVVLIENSKRSFAFCKQFLEKRGFEEYGYEDKQLKKGVENALNYYFIKPDSKYL